MVLDDQYLECGIESIYVHTYNMKITKDSSSLYQIRNKQYKRTFSIKYVPKIHTNKNKYYQSNWGLFCKNWNYCFSIQSDDMNDFILAHLW